MHKTEAAELFAVLGDADRVKILKMLYAKGDLDFGNLLSIIGSAEHKLEEDLEILEAKDLIDKKGDKYGCNTELIDDLMSFISTPCGCCK